MQQAQSRYHTNLDQDTYNQPYTPDKSIAMQIKEKEKGKRDLQTSGICVSLSLTHFSFPYLRLSQNVQSLRIRVP